MMHVMKKLRDVLVAHESVYLAIDVSDELNSWQFQVPVDIQEFWRGYWGWHACADRMGAELCVHRGDDSEPEVLWNPELLSVVTPRREFDFRHVAKEMDDGGFRYWKNRFVPVFDSQDFVWFALVSQKNESRYEIWEYNKMTDDAPFVVASNLEEFFSLIFWRPEETNYEFILMSKSAELLRAIYRRDLPLVMRFGATDVLDESAFEFRSVLHFAVECGWPEIVLYLLKSGWDRHVDIVSNDDDQVTPLQCAWNASVAKLLLEAGADINAQDAKGRTLLHKGNELAEFCILSNASTTVRDANGLTAVESWNQSPNPIPNRKRLEKLISMPVRDASASW
jgi:FAD/FMN-containing dehydrogenase